MKDGKAAIRADIRRRLEAMAPNSRAAASMRVRDRLNRMPEFASAKSIFIFISTAIEVDTHPLIDEALAAGKTILVPRIAGQHGMEAVEFPGWKHLRPGPLEILSPDESAPVWYAPIHCVLVPGLAFSETGGRVGYGGGYYDRWLATHPYDYCIALAFEEQIVGPLRLQPYDVHIPLIATDRRFINNAARLRSN